MEKIVIKGGSKLEGEVKISGAKNAALPILAASLLLPRGIISLHNVPNLTDVNIMGEMLTSLGAEVKWENTSHNIFIKTSNLNSYVAPADLTKQMRATFLVLAPLLVRFGKAKVALPGGCAIGNRPVNMHLEGLAKLGASIEKEDNYVYLHTKQLKGSHIILSYPSVGATEALIMAAINAEGETTISNAAEEPEIVELANFLKEAGASIEGAGTKQIHVIGVKPDSLKAVDYTIIPDRIEAATYLLAAAITKSKLKIKPIIAEHLTEVLDKLKSCGFKVEIKEDNSASVTPIKEDIQPVFIETRPYPGFPTDMQAQFIALLSLAKGTSIIKETVFENRFLHIPELNKLGANIEVDGNTAIVKGTERLRGTVVKATDLRASAALVLAGLVAEKTTLIEEIHHLRRGYEDMEGKLKQIGAQIEKLNE
jgi:UDP-N-acetylglucosamine 1-carboxyvinyltransferase